MKRNAWFPGHSQFLHQFTCRKNCHLGWTILVWKAKKYKIAFNYPLVVKFFDSKTLFRIDIQRYWEKCVFGISFTPLKPKRASFFNIEKSKTRFSPFCLDWVSRSEVIQDNVCQVAMYLWKGAFLDSGSQEFFLLFSVTEHNGAGFSLISPDLVLDDLY